MTRDLQRQLDQVNFDLRLRPSPELLRRKREIIAEIDRLTREETTVMDLANALNPTIPIKEASRRFADAALKLLDAERCPTCQRLVRSPGYCLGCKTEGQDWR